MSFQNPDFGFNNDLIFEDNSQHIGEYSRHWKYFLDYAKLFPRFERVTNFIKFAKKY